MTETEQNYFSTALGEFVYYRTYSRWRYDLGRREHWPETVQRVMDYFREIGGDKIPEQDYLDLHDGMLTQKSLPSMRLVSMAGEAARRQNLCCYNCSTIAIDSVDAFGEVLYLLSQGVGVGFGVQRKYVDQLPIAYVADDAQACPGRVEVQDSSEGWADAFKEILTLAYEGRRAVIDASLVRPAGAVLYTKGGRSSGALPLVELLEFAQAIVLKAAGENRKLRPIEAHDICCKAGTAIVVGGVRRSATISLSDLDDEEMRQAKSGPFWEHSPWRAMANNSAVYDEKVPEDIFWKEWNSLADSGTGERGIWNQLGARTKRPSRREDADFLVNPCGESVMRPNGGLCNLSEVVVRPGDTLADLKKKVRLAAIFGTLQSSLVHFPYVRPSWVQNAVEERLLGVSLSGIFDHAELRHHPSWFSELKDIAIATNTEYASILGISPSVACTLSKPSGTVSQLVGCASGVHPRWSPYYIRRVRVTAHDSLCKLMQVVGAPMKPEVGQDLVSPNTWVIEFPVKSPEGAICRNDVTAIEQLDQVLTIQRSYAQHGTSCTIYVEENEWDEVGQHVLDNFDDIAGLSFLPKTNIIYPLSPYEDIDEETYYRLLSEFPAIPYHELHLLENYDLTDGPRELACTGISCEI